MEQAVIKRCLDSAFTLVELAIVLVIIGLLVGGVLQGQELIQQAKIRKQIRQISDIEIQMNTFVSKYNCLPGDCLKATKFLGTTDSSGNTISDGDGDSIIRDKTSSVDECLNPTIVGELTQYFLHLNLAGISNYTATSSAGAMPGSDFPTAAYNGNTGIVVSCLASVVHPTLTPSFLKTGNIIIIGTSGQSTSRLGYATGLYIAGGGSFGSTAGPIGIPAEVINQIDQKIDDALPSSGRFGIISGESACGSNVGVYPSGSLKCLATAGKRIN